MTIYFFAAVNRHERLAGLIGKQKNLFNPVFKLTTTFYNVSGLQVGNNIRFSGIDVGIVDNIRLINDSTVQVDMLIRKNVQQFIKADCEAAIGSEGIIGDRVLIVTQGSDDAPVAKDGQRITSVEPVETDAIMAGLQTTAINAAIITEQLAEIMININNYLCVFIYWTNNIQASYKCFVLHITVIVKPRCNKYCLIVS